MANQERVDQNTFKVSKIHKWDLICCQNNVEMMVSKWGIQSSCNIKSLLNLAFATEDFLILLLPVACTCQVFNKWMFVLYHCLMFQVNIH